MFRVNPPGDPSEAHDGADELPAALPEGRHADGAHESKEILVVCPPVCQVCPAERRDGDPAQRENDERWVASETHGNCREETMRWRSHRRQRERACHGGGVERGG